MDLNERNEREKSNLNVEKESRFLNCTWARIRLVTSN